MSAVSPGRGRVAGRHKVRRNSVLVAQWHIAIPAEEAYTASIADVLFTIEDSSRLSKMLYHESTIYEVTS